MSVLGWLLVLYAAVLSWARLEGAPVEVLIGVADPSDPAAEVARRLERELPGRVRLIVGGPPPAPSP